ncbi:MAG TPA: photosynthetic reaction center subunit H [Steroidobacteraceae bacterium]|nr:photosynthetic reaction center subunit H [Steroidobacteraceae bacterium]
MTNGAITGYIDVAQLALYGFWVFFIALIIYLRREDKREGYPLQNDNGRVKVQGFPAVPAPKAFRLADGRTVLAPDPAKDGGPIAAVPTAGGPGSPLEPTGDPMMDGVGPGAYALRANHPERALDGGPLIVPLRNAPGFSVAAQDPDPRGMSAVGADGERGGTVTDLWVDRAEPMIRYLEVTLNDGTRTVLVPMPMARIDTYRNRVVVRSILGSQFAAVPAIAAGDHITLAEEDRVTAYFGAGTLYAEASRAEPLL